MSEQEFELYLKLLSRCLNLTAGQREQIADEFRDHLEERLEELARAGVPREKAVFQALDEFGDAAVLAAHFSTIAHLKRRRFLMRLSLGSVAALAAGLLVAFAFWPQNGPVQGPQAVFAQNKAKPGMKAGSPNAPSAKAQAPKSAGMRRVMAQHPLSSDVGDYPRFEQALDQTVDFVIDPEPLKDAIDFISQRYQMPILIDTLALEEANIKTNAEVKMPIAGIKLRQMLSLLLAQLSQPLGFDIQDGVLQITTLERIRERRVVVVYDCRDLIHLRPAIPGVPPAMGVRQPAFGAQPASGGSSMFAVNPAADQVKHPAQGPPAKPAEKNAEKSPERAPACREPFIPLIRVIQYADTEDNWFDEQGQPKVTELGGLLVVNQNPIVHERIKRILADLRRMRKEGAFATQDKDQLPTAASEPVVNPPKDK